MDPETRYSVQERVTTKSIVLTQRQFRRDFPGRNAPSRRTVRRLLDKYYLWGYLKDRVYSNNPQTIEALKENIRREIRRIPREMLDRVITNFNVRVGAVIQRRGSWIEHIINY